MKKELKPLSCAAEICNALPKGILLTTQKDGKVNTMTIGWGSIGVEWGKPIFTVYVRNSRYTRELLDETSEFTINAPIGTADPKIISLCGTKSGREVDKIGELGLTLEEPLSISVPGIKELPLTLECKVLFRQPQELPLHPQPILERFYSKGSDAGDYHIAYIGEIVSAYQIV